MKISLKMDDKNFISEIDYVVINQVEDHEFEMMAKIKDAYCYWIPIASANSVEELKIWWDMVGSPAQIV